MVNSPIELDEDLKTDVLGARRTVVFVEGEKNSLDEPLYSLMFPSASVVPRGARKSVEDAVKSIRALSERHWIKAYGIVDNDGRNIAAEIKKLREDGIYPIDVYSVESIYLDQRVQEEVAKRRTNLTGDDVSSRLEPAKAAAINAIRANADHLAQFVAVRKIREQIFKHLPNPKTSPLDQPIQIDVDVPNILHKERQTVEQLLDQGDLASIVRKYPIKKTGVLSVISKRLGFDGEQEYSRAVIKLLKDDINMRDHVNDLLGSLPTEVLEGR